MSARIFHRVIPTNDPVIRSALRENLRERHANIDETRIIEEFGLGHGSVRIDIALIGGMFHGYEIKSDRDTLERLPDQMKEFNAVFDEVCLVVGKRHLYNAVHLIPEWWGIILAKTDAWNQVVFQTIRDPIPNNRQDKVSIARLLWREEALQLLEEYDKASGVRSKPREFIYQRLANILEADILKEEVRKVLLAPRKDWRFGQIPMPSGG